ncbi:transporter substrate-binding domain-containing protein [Vibrio sp. Of7-15]|uniref:substrate-binding periplasmic protein n=1 Tax=Vibrio sp. Of7-15 TaxID=2724879 RepID=UPI001EF2EE4E|nr:transporter substrate-binding domain-containing protein [Vibrio sp. Of7-15]
MSILEIGSLMTRFMKRIIKLIWFIGFVCSAVGVSAAELSGKVVTFCAEDGEWPPFNFFLRENGVKTKKSVGYDLDVLRAILIKHDIVAKFEIIPWKRCLNLTKRGRYDAILSASLNPERVASFITTEPYYSITPSYFYLREDYPGGLSFQAVQKIDSKNICGRQGYNYVNFGFDNRKIQRVAKDHDTLIKMTIARRCKVFLARSEIFFGLNYLGLPTTSYNQLDYKNIPNINPETFHVLISRQFKYANELKLIIDKGVDELKKSGELETFLRKYIPR